MTALDVSYGDSMREVSRPRLLFRCPVPRRIRSEIPKFLWLVVIKFCGLMGFFLAGIHAFFSVSLLTPAYYAKYFDLDGRLNLEGELALSVGVVALFLLMSPAITTLPMMPKALGSQRWKRNQRLGYVALILVVVHLVVLGLEGWLAPSGWNGGLPPISLVAVLAALTPLLVKGKLIHDQHETHPPGS